MSDDAILRLRRDGLTWRDVDDEVVILDLNTSAYLSINASGGVLWRRLAEGVTQRQLVDELTSRFGIDGVDALADVEAFVESCRSRGYIVDSG